MPHEAFEQREFLCGQHHRLVCPRHTPSQRIEHQIADLKPKTYLGAIPAAQCSDSREKFSERKRLGQIIIRAAVQPANFHIDRVTSGQQKNRSRYVFLSKLAANLESIHPRQCDVEEYEGVV